MDRNYFIQDDGLNKGTIITPLIEDIDTIHCMCLQNSDFIQMKQFGKAELYISS